MSLYSAVKSSVLIPVRSGNHKFNIVFSEDLGDYLEKRRPKLGGYIAITLESRYEKITILGMKHHRYVCSKTFNMS